MSVGQLCDAGFTAVFRKNEVEIVKNEDALVKGPAYMTGNRNQNTDFLWVTDINEEKNNKTTTEIKLTANSVYALKSILDVITYHHQSIWSPTERTWTQAIDKGHFVKLPGLNRQAVRKYLQPSITTAKGHMSQVRQNLQSTKEKNELRMTGEAIEAEP